MAGSAGAALPAPSLGLSEEEQLEIALAISASEAATQQQAQHYHGGWPDAAAAGDSGGSRAAGPATASAGSIGAAGSGADAAAPQQGASRLGDKVARTSQRLRDFGRSLIRSSSPEPPPQPRSNGAAPSSSIPSSSWTAVPPWPPSSASQPPRQQQQQASLLNPHQHPIPHTHPAAGAARTPSATVPAPALAAGAGGSPAPGRQQGGSSRVAGGGGGGGGGNSSWGGRPTPSAQPQRWQAGGVGGGGGASSSSAAGPPGLGVDHTLHDEAVARALQEQYDRETGNRGAVGSSEAVGSSGAVGSSSAAGGSAGGGAQPHHLAGAPVPHADGYPFAPLPQTAGTAPASSGRMAGGGGSGGGGGNPFAPTTGWDGGLAPMKGKGNPPGSGGGSGGTTGAPAQWPAPRPSPSSAAPPPASRPTDPNTCAGCRRSFGWLDGVQRISAMGSSWHVGCFVCAGCGHSFGSGTFTVGSDSLPYHGDCHRQRFVPTCVVCGGFVPAQPDGRVMWNEHPFWKERYCPLHNQDRTPRCGSCRRLQHCGEQWPPLDDGRHLCYLCVSSVVVDTKDAQPLYQEVLRFYAAMGLPLPPALAPPPLLLVDGPALNEQGARMGRGAGEDLEGPVFHTRGLCMAEERVTVRTTVAGGLVGRLLGGPAQQTVQYGNPETSVTGILVLAGLPRLLTGSIIAHEVMHAYFRLAGYGRLPPEVEEGTCQLMALLWLESSLPASASRGSASVNTTSSDDNNNNNNNSSSNGSSASPQPPPPGPPPATEERLASFFAHEIRNDTSPVYGDGFRAAYDCFARVGLYRLLQHIRAYRSFPIDD